ncbi:hypothetical protein FQZ97_820260 [compost metagenome]
MRRPWPLRPLPGRPVRRQFRQARGGVRRQPPERQKRHRAGLGTAPRRARPGSPAELRDPVAGRCGDRCAAIQPGAPPGRAQARGGAEYRAGSDHPPVPGRGAATGHARAGLRPAPPQGRPQLPMAPAPAGKRHPRGAAAAAGPASGPVAGHGGGVQRPADHRRLAGPAGKDLRHGGGRRLDHHRRPPVRPAEWRGGGQRRADEPADPFRRGPDEPRLLHHAQPGRRTGNDPRGARGAQPDGRRTGRGGGGRRGGHPRGDPGRQPDHPRAAPGLRATLPGRTGRAARRHGRDRTVGAQDAAFGDGMGTAGPARDAPARTQAA